MKKRITIVYTRGKRRVCTLTYVAEIKAAFCTGFDLTLHPKMQGIAWNDVISVTILPVPEERP